MNVESHQHAGPDHRHSRSARGRVLIVGPAPGTELPPLPRAIFQVSNIFDALGEVTIATAREPIELVLIPREALDSISASAADAIRQVDPSVKVVLLTNHDLRFNGVAAGDTATFDATVRLPEEGHRLLQLLGEAPLPGPVATSETEARPKPRPNASAAAPPAPPTSTPPIPESPTVTELPAELDELVLEERLELADDSLPGSVGGSATADLPDDQARLGDVDLVDRVLAHPGALRDLALRLIAQQTGWSDVRLLSEDEASDPNQVKVESSEHCYGRLTCASATREQLSPWAEWLARWLSLDRSYNEFRRMAYQDDLTSAWNRRFFDSFLTVTLRQAAEVRQQISVMVFDIDDFKRYNDDYGHAAGDVVLAETVRLLTSVIRRGDRVCRIGGDEFAVIFADLGGPRALGSQHPSSPEQIARRFQDQICQMRFPKLGLEAPGNLSVSAGLATFPWDGMTPQQLLECADERALQSKRRGKNAMTIGPDSGRGVGRDE